jgi:hypothetical protein
MSEQPPQQPSPSQPYGAPAGQQYPTQPYPQAYPPQRPTAGAPSKGLAVTALVLAILGFFVLTAIAAVILAIVVPVQSRDGRPRGKGMAISALVISALWVVAFIILIVAVVNSQPERDSSGQVVDGGQVLVTSIRVGDCLAKQPGESTQLTVGLTPCSKPHREEAYANFNLKGGDFPGQAEVDRLAEGGCFSRFEKYVGISVDESRLEVVYLRPLEESWDVDPGVTCLVSEGTSSTGTLRNSKR